VEGVVRVILDHERCTLFHGDCRDLLEAIPENSVDAIVCDPPYLLANASGTGFMGREWDSVELEPGETVGTASERWHRTWAAIALRVLKPGGHLLAFGGSRTVHRMCSALEDVEFEIRDVLMWVYGSGFPKSLDVSKAIDKHLGAERTVTGQHEAQLPGGNTYAQDSWSRAAREAPPSRHDDPATAAAAWTGWGTALKPAYEPIVLARKPLSGTVAKNVLERGTGGINIGGCRIGDEPRHNNPSGGSPDDGSVYGLGCRGRGTDAIGRWPANVLLSHHEDCRYLGEVEDERVTRVGGNLGPDARLEGTYGMGKQSTTTTTTSQYECHPECPARILEGQHEGASRFFYCSKPSTKERDLGLEHLPVRSGGEIVDREEDSAGIKNPRAGAGRGGGRRNHHVTVKPLELMRYLCRLVTPPGGTVLDVFAGSGSTGVAALAEGFNFVGVELGGDDGSHLPILLGRIRHALGLISGTDEQPGA
jgi:site-specific DNA-methyltransferase (adenine-specific)